MITAREKAVLRELGKKYAEIAALPVHKETKRLWEKLNTNKPERPMVNIDQIPWGEMDVDGSLKNVVTDGFWRGVETSLRRDIYQWTHMPADMVIENRVLIPKAVKNTGYGYYVSENTLQQEGFPAIVSHAYRRQISDFDDIEKIKTPRVSLDTDETMRRREIAEEIFGGVLPIHMSGWQPSLHVWDRLIVLMGVEETMYDCADRPDFVLAAVNKYIDAANAEIDQYIALGLFELDIPVCHCSYTYHPDDLKRKKMWCMSAAQIFVNLSPEMHEKFDLIPLADSLKRFDSIYYGCCEPLHNKVEIIRRHIPNLRKLSASPWADPYVMAAGLGGDVIMSRKPNPAYVGAPGAPDWDSDIADIRRTLHACRGHNTPVEFILKDISTLHHQPQRLWEWEKRVMEIVKE